MKKFYLLFALCIIAFSCTPRVYSSNNSVEKVYSYKEIAIIPPTVNFNTEAFDFTRNNLDILNLEYSQKFHNAIYSWFLKRKTENGYPFKIQDVVTTINKLKQSPIHPKDLTNEELADFLDVDAVITSDFFVSKPFPKGLNVVSQVIIGKSIAQSNSSLSMNLFDQKSKESIWNYNYEMTSEVSSPEQLVNELLRNASKNFPKIKKKN